MVQERVAETRVVKGDIKIGLEVAYAVTRIVVPAFEAKTEKRLILAKQVECVCELYFPAGIGGGLGNGIPDRGFQKVAAENAEPRWCMVSRWFFHEADDPNRPIGLAHLSAPDLNNTEAFDILGLDFPNGNKASAGLLVCANQLANNRLAANHNYIREQNDEGIVAQKRPRAGNGVGQT